jgi:outer membrane protein
MQKPVEQNFEIERPQLAVPTSASLAENPQQIYQTAEKSLPQIKAAEIRIDNANQQIKITKGGFSPTLDMTFGYFTNYSGLATAYSISGVEERQSQYYYRDANNAVVPVYQLAPIGSSQKIGFNSQFKDNIRQSLSFSLNVPIFSNWQNHTNLSNAKIQRYNAELNVQTTKNTLRQEVEQAWLDARTASKRFESTQKQVQSLSEAMRANEQRLNVGAINSVDYTQSKTNLARAASELVRAKYDLVLRIKLLDFYLGKGLDLN